MKAFILLSVVFFVSYFEATSGQDVNRRLEIFINDSLAGLPNWIKEQGKIPDPLKEGGTFKLTSKTANQRPFYNLTGEITNRFYHGAENNIKAHNLKADLGDRRFNIDLYFGDGENAFVEGSYSLKGTISGSPVNGDGVFRKTIQLNPFHVRMVIRLTETDKGHFKMDILTRISESPKFDNFTMEGLNPGQNDERHILPIVEAWATGPMSDTPHTAGYWYDYMKEVFAATPIVDIIGSKLAPN